MKPRSRQRRAFTLIEVMIASGLTVFLAMLLASAWQTVGKSIVDLTVRTEIAQEMDMATAALSRDLGGSLYLAGSSTTVPFSAWSYVDNALLLEYAGGHSVSYRITDHTLVRRYTYGTDTVEFVVARDVDDWTVTDGGTTMTIQLDFGHYRSNDTSYENPLYKRTCVLIANRPS